MTYVFFTSIREPVEAVLMMNDDAGGSADDECWWWMMTQAEVLMMNDDAGGSADDEWWRRRKPTTMWSMMPSRCERLPRPVRFLTPKR